MRQVAILTVVNILETGLSVCYVEFYVILNFYLWFMCFAGLDCKQVPVDTLPQGECSGGVNFMTLL